MLLTSTLCQYSLSIDYIVQQQQAIVKLITINQKSKFILYSLLIPLNECTLKNHTMVKSRHVLK